MAKTRGWDPRSGLEAWTRVLGADFMVPVPESAAETAAASCPTPRPTTAPTRSPSLEEIEAQVATCTACALHKGRQHTVFADGSSTARVFFVGEGPGADEDRTGIPFVGKAGQLLTRMIAGAMGMARKEVYIANVVKCRPPGNRNPSPEEQGRCGPFLKAQIDAVDPDILICLGAVAARHLLETELGAGRLRGRVHEYLGRPVVVTWHPAYLLRNPSAKRETWEDIKLALRTLGLPEDPPPLRES